MAKIVAHDPPGDVIAQMGAVLAANAVPPATTREILDAATLTLATAPADDLDPETLTTISLRSARRHGVRASADAAGLNREPFLMICAGLNANPLSWSTVACNVHRLRALDDRAAARAAKAADDRARADALRDAAADAHAAMQKTGAPR
jgi:hypothetical protein